MAPRKPKKSKEEPKAAKPALEPENYVPFEPEVATATKDDLKGQNIPDVGPNEKLFECPAGHVHLGRLDADSVWCSPCGLKANPRR